VTRTLMALVSVVLLVAASGCSTALTAPPAVGSPSSAPAASPTPAVPAGTPVPTAALPWTSAGRMAETRVGHTATLLRDGRVLVAGGFADGEANSVRVSAELYDPANGSWSRTGDMLQARAGHTATLLADGTVLVAGGGTTPTDFLDSAELFDPNTGSWRATGKLHAPLANAAAVLLPDGRVLLVGGESSGDPQRTAQLYDPVKRTWSFTGEMMSTPRSGPTATRTNPPVTTLTVGSLKVVGKACK